MPGFGAVPVEGREVWGRGRAGGGGTCHKQRSPSRDVLHAMMLAPSSIGRIELARNVVGCKASTRSTQT